ncbi:glycoside hydrolase family 3 N-terminal domain-containing protein [Marmoricola sp. RAF53]|uniref:glycoside hydrolase family 3 N-terminal domain-containing protein n=1 Tax=Marmoricola sp. RAF53 TaxID=3233059 RepID=UPI003F9976B8
MKSPSHPVRAALVGGALLAVTAAVAVTAPTQAQRPEPSAGPATGPRAALAASTTSAQRAAQLVAGMTLAEKAGQVIVASYAGTRAPVALVRDLHLGGVVPVAHNITSPAQIRGVNRAVAKVVEARGYPAFLGVDQEGGTVSRLGAPVTGFGAFLGAGAARRPDLTRAAYRALGEEMVAAGFTVVLAPVADVTAGASDPAIGSRSAGSRPKAVAVQVVAAQQGLADAGVVGVLKHFPGHGSVRTDSHLALPVQHKTLARLMAGDLVPFRRAIAAGAGAVMIGHLDIRAVDPGVPASVSRKVITGLLRHDLGFDGLVMTDALGMHGVADRYPSRVVGWRTLLAGSDVVLMPADARAARNGIVTAVRRGRLPQARLDQAATRMIAALLDQRDRARPAPFGSGAEAARRLASAALTSVSGPCRGRVVPRAVRVTGAPAAVGAFRRAARVEGLGLGTGPKIALTVRTPVPGRARAAVVVALDRPGVLGRSVGRVRLASYGQTPAAMRAVVRFLLGRDPAPGRLPVTVRGVPRHGC